MKITMRFTGRPYPRDRERRRLIRIELAKRDMTITELAAIIDIPRPNLSAVINGTRRSMKTEERIAVFFGKRREELFPDRSKYELEKMGQSVLPNCKAGIK